ncbi:MAG: tRNA (N6-isopentenyl adenosine(37)-C2)-methylthiotransferase MiaB [Sulfuriferula sp.]
MVKKIYIKTFGCQMNEYDSDIMADVMRDAEGLTPTDNPADADVILFNTCSVREKAQEKVFSDLGRVRELKEANPNLLIGVGGCVASQEGATIISRAPYVDVVFGPQTLHRLPELLAQRRATGRPQMDISFPEIEKFDNLPTPSVDGGAAFVSIMEGCSKYCSFCVVPYTRGEEVSRPFDDILAEIAKLTEQGVKEIHLLGQNVNAYRGMMEDGEMADFALLLDYVHDMPGIERLRFTTSHPREFTQRLIDCYARLPKLVSLLHLPVQSGSDRILAAMKRGYTSLEYKSIIRRLREIRPDMVISSDFIIGFPGETDADFEATMKLIEDVGFDSSYSFIYSKRPGTPAADLPDDVPQAVKQARLSALKEAVDVHVHRISFAMVDTLQRVLVTGVSKKDSTILSARTDNNRSVHFIGDASLIGQFVDVKITHAQTYSLRGELVPA